jgi:hypothetical protein
MKMANEDEEERKRAAMQKTGGIDICIFLPMCYVKKSFETPAGYDIGVLGH